MITENDELRSLLSSAKTIAVVGASPKPWRDSGAITIFLIQKGYTVYPVNPRYQDIHGMKCYPDLRAVPGPIDIVDIFRNPEEVLPTIDEAIEVKAKAVWMQLGVVNTAAASKAESAGLKVVMDRCIAVEHRSLIKK
jgi:predicted CoA-binding protein